MFLCFFCFINKQSFEIHFNIYMQTVIQKWFTHTQNLLTSWVEARGRFFSRCRSSLRSQSSFWVSFISVDKFKFDKIIINSKACLTLYQVHFSIHFNRTIHYNIGILQCCYILTQFLFQFVRIFLLNMLSIKTVLTSTIK